MTKFYMYLIYSSEEWGGGRGGGAGGGRGKRLGGETSNGGKQPGGTSWGETTREKMRAKRPGTTPMT